MKYNKIQNRSQKNSYSCLPLKLFLENAVCMSDMVSRTFLCDGSATRRLSDLYHILFQFLLVSEESFPLNGKSVRRKAFVLKTIMLNILQSLN
jgi:hypothetical protein